MVLIFWLPKLVLPFFLIPHSLLWVLGGGQSGVGLYMRHRRWLPVARVIGRARPRHEMAMRPLDPAMLGLAAPIRQ